MTDTSDNAPDYRTRMVDNFAAAALQGILAAGPNMRQPQPFDIAKQAYRYADAMLAAREENDR